MDPRALFATSLGSLAQTMRGRLPRVLISDKGSAAAVLERHGDELWDQLPPDFAFWALGSGRSPRGHGIDRGAYMRPISSLS